MNFEVRELSYDSSSITELIAGSVTCLIISLFEFFLFCKIAMLYFSHAYGQY